MERTLLEQRGSVFLPVLTNFIPEHARISPQHKHGRDDDSSDIIIVAEYLVYKRVARNDNHDR